MTGSRAGEALRFTVELALRAEGTLTVIAATASPTGDGGGEVRVTLSTAARVDAELVNIAGRRVAIICSDRELDAGCSTLNVSGIGVHSTRLPSGRYLVRITARSEGGQQATRVCALQVGR